MTHTLSSHPVANYSQQLQNVLLQNIDATFLQDVCTGLSTNPKRLSCKYFYDDRGSEIFQAIMGLPEYYLTDCEFEILTDSKGKLLEILQQDDRPFDVIELGAGDGLKTKILLQYFLEQGASFNYVPIDISSQAVNYLTDDLQQSLPHLQVRGICDDYFHALHQLQRETNRRHLVLFLGSSIGNFANADALEFLQHIRENLNPGDFLLTGFDLMKQPELILQAYSDSQGVTRDFNLNLLRRINRELGGTFSLDHFQHYASYNPLTGETSSYLLSTRSQTVEIRAADQSFHFDAWEAIHMEISQKYTLNRIGILASQAGFIPVQDFLDHQNYFVDALWGIELAD